MNNLVGLRRRADFAAQLGRACVGAWALSFVLGMTVACEQLKAQPPKFEVASIKISKPTRTSATGGTLQTGPATLRATNATLLVCMRAAYGDEYFQFRLPGWARTERFDVEAKAATPVPKAELMAMFRSLLAERFNLVSHAETQDLLAYALVANKKVLLEDSDPEAQTKWHDQDGAFTFKHITLRGFVDFLNSTGTILFHLDLPVVNLTEIDGFHDFTLSYPLEEFMADTDGMLIFQALRKLGLDLSRRKVQIKTLVVDRLERPSEN